jgi:hypothetical protein
MTRFVASLFIGHREAIPHDGSRLLVAGGRMERREDAEAREADGVEAVRRAGREAWRVHQQRGGGQ